MVELPLVGGCQCGGLRYAISEPPLMVYNCHCTNCQKIGGGAFSTPVTVRESSFAFTQRRADALTSGPRTPAIAATVVLRRLRQPHRHGQIPAAGYPQRARRHARRHELDRAGRRHLDAQRATLGRAFERPHPHRAAADGLHALHRAIPRAGAVRGLTSRDVATSMPGSAALNDSHPLGLLAFRRLPHSAGRPGRRIAG